MTEEETPIAWIALDKGHPVVAADGAEVGRLSRVVADEQKDIFSGIAFRSGLLEHERFAPADIVGQITSGSVRLKIGPDEVEALGPYEG
ncbi:MAG: hypothetical protein ABR529_03240 [Actinomycetota bacterium]